MVGRAKELGMPALAITDHGNLFGLIEFYREANRQGIRPVLGIEAYLAPSSRHDRTGGKGERNNYHLVLLARNQTGYQNLLKLSSYAYLEGLYHRPRVDRELLTKYGEGLIGLSGCLNGEVNVLLREDRFDEARKAAEFYREVLDSFYLELQDHGIADEKKVLRRLVDLGREIDLPLVATNDSHYIHKDHAGAHDALLCIQTGKVQSDANRLRFETPEMYLKKIGRAHV